MLFAFLFVSTVIMNETDVDPRKIIEYVQQCGVGKMSSRRKYYTTTIIAKVGESRYIVNAAECPGSSGLQISYVCLKRFDLENLKSVGIILEKKRNIELNFKTINIPQEDVRKYRNFDMYGKKIKISNRANVEFGVNPNRNYWVGLCWPKERVVFSTIYINANSALKQYLDNIVRFVSENKE